MRKFRIGRSTYEYHFLFAALLSAGMLASNSESHKEEFNLLYSAINTMMGGIDGELEPNDIRNIVVALKGIEIPSCYPELRNFLETVRTEAKRIPELF